MTVAHARRIAVAAVLAVASTTAALTLAGNAAATTATGASAAIAFSGTGTSMKVATTVRFTSTYTGSYNVRYDIYRSTSSTKVSPTKVTSATVFTRTFATAKGKVYVYGPNSSRCAAGKTTYFYWVQGSVTDTAGGTVTVVSPTVAAKGCTSL